MNDTLVAAAMELRLASDQTPEIFERSKCVGCRQTELANEVVLGYENGRIYFVTLPFDSPVCPPLRLSDVPSLDARLHEPMRSFQVTDLMRSDYHGPMRIVLSYGRGLLQVWEFSPRYRAWLWRKVLTQGNTPLCASGLTWSGADISYSDADGIECALRYYKRPFCDPYWAP